MSLTSGREPCAGSVTYGSSCDAPIVDFGAFWEACRREIDTHGGITYTTVTLRMSTLRTALDTAGILFMVMPVAFLVSLCTTVALTPVVIALARKAGLLDRPAADRFHRVPTPLLGGLGILVATALGIYITAPDSAMLSVLILSMALVALVGLWDDKTAIAPKWKLLALVPGAVAAVLLFPGEMPAFWWPVFVLGFLFVSNSVNLLDTLDGLTGLMTALSAAAFGTMASFQGLSELSIAAFAVSGACVGFLFFNWRLILPAAIFLGDMGSLALGAALFIFVACLAQHATSPADFVAVLLPIGLVTGNALLTMYIRKRKGLKALARSKDHISERLCRAGVPAPEVTMWMGLVTLVSCVAGVVAWVASSLSVELVAIAIGVFGIGYLAFYSFNLDLPPEGSPRYRDKTICRIITRFDVGGPSQHCIHLANTLEKMGWETYLMHGNIDPETESSMEYLAKLEGVNTYRIEAMQREARPLADLRALWQLYRMIRQLRPQVVHTHHAKAGTLGRLAAGLCGVPIIVHTFHGLSLRGYFSPVKNRIFLAMEQICARVSSALVTIGPNDRDELIQMRVAPPSALVTIPLGLPLERFADTGDQRTQFRSQLGLDDDEKLILYVGRMVPIKNVPSFIDMAANVLRQRENLRFLLVGDGPLRDELETQASDLGIADRVRFYGVTDQMARIYAGADMVVLCSRREGMPVTMLEALAAARPVVCTDVGNVTNSVIDGVTGRLVPPDDTDALTEAVLAALDDYEGSLAMARAGQKHVLEAFSIETLTERLDALYSALACQEEYVDPIGAPALGAVVRQPQESS